MSPAEQVHFDRIGIIERHILEETGPAAKKRRVVPQGVIVGFALIEIRDFPRRKAIFVNQIGHELSGMASGWSIEFQQGIMEHPSPGVAQQLQIIAD